MSSEQERYLRWMELMWERQMSNAREERRTAEVLEALRHVAEDSGRLAVPPEYETEGGVAMAVTGEVPTDGAPSGVPAFRGRG